MSDEAIMYVSMGVFFGTPCILILIGVVSSIRDRKERPYRVMEPSFKELEMMGSQDVDTRVTNKKAP